MAMGVGCVWLWAVEAWFRPAWCCRVPEWVWLAGCLTAAGTLAWLGARRRPVGLLAALPMARWLAVWISAAIIRADFTVCTENIYNDGMGFSPESQLESCLDFSPACRRLLAVYLGVPKDMGMPSCFDMVACSRPETRRKFIALSLAKPDAVRGFAHHGARLFASSVGQDVDCAFRRAIAADLTGLLDHPASGSDTRAMAAMWLGMVFLTDPKEFAHLRLPAREGMLACDDPPYCRFGDQWMRTLDCLLAYDPPGSWDSLAAGFARNPKLLSRAVRERVRGTLVSLEAIRHETARRTQAGEWEGAIALWVETGRLLAAWPDDLRREEIGVWRREVLSGWLESGRLGQDEAFEQAFRLLDRLPEDPLVEPEPAGREAAFHKALQLLEPLSSGAVNLDHIDDYWRIHRQVEIANGLLPFLDPDQRRHVVRTAAAFWVLPTPDSGAKGRSHFDWCYNCRDKLGTHWNDLDENHRTMARRSFKAYWEHNGSTGITVQTPGLTPEDGILDDVEWLLTALAGYLVRAIDPHTTPPGLEMAARERLAAALEAGVAAALSADPSAWWDKIIEGLRTCRGGKPFPAKLEQSLLSRMPGRKQIQVSGFDGLAWIQQLLEERMPSRFPKDPPPEVAAWSKPGAVREALAAAFTRQQSLIRELMDKAEKHPPHKAVLAAAWDDLTVWSRQGPLPSRIAAYGGLFRLAPQMPAAGRSAMRESFLRFFRRHLVAHQDWPGWMLESATTPESARGGLGIPWEDDALSAALSWWSEIGEETYPMRQRDAAASATGAFSYIAQAYMDFEGFSGRRGAPGIDQVIRAREWPRSPSPVPFPPTPWQRARALHEARPELHFPDRALPRPRTGFTIAWCA